MGIDTEDLAKLVSPLGAAVGLGKKKKGATADPSLQFQRQAEQAQQKERATALEDSIKRRKKTGTAVRRLGSLGGVGNTNSASNSTLG